jgi:hypothetical protein
MGKAEPFRDAFNHFGGNIVYTETVATSAATTNATAKVFEVGSGDQSSAITPWGTDTSGDLWNMAKNVLNYAWPSSPTQQSNHLIQFDKSTLTLEFKNNKNFTANAWFVEVQPRIDSPAGTGNGYQNAQVAWNNGVATLGQVTNGSVAAGRMPPELSPYKNYPFTRLFKIKRCKRVCLHPGDKYKWFMKAPGITLTKPVGEIQIFFDQVKKINRQLLVLVWGDVSHDVGVPTAVQYASAVLDYIALGECKGRLNPFTQNNDNLLMYDTSVNPTAANVVVQDEENYNVPITTGIA